MKKLLNLTKIDFNVRKRSGDISLYSLALHVAGFTIVSIIKPLIEHPNIDLTIRNDQNQIAKDMLLLTQENNYNFLEK
jgi:hypothetical protein